MSCILGSPALNFGSEELRVMRVAKRCKALQSVAKCAKQPAHSACTGLLVRAENLLCWTNCVVTAITYGTMDAVATNSRK